MTEQEKAKLIIEISKLNAFPLGSIPVVKLKDVLELIRDWSVEE